MYLQEILEVCIGLVFAWLVISLAAMQLQEWLANLLKWRSNDLSNAIRKMLANETLYQQFYEHQIIVGHLKEKTTLQKRWGEFLNRSQRRSKGKNPKLNSENTISKYNKPSYIPSSDFVTTVFDLVMKAGTDASPVQAAFSQLNSAIDEAKEIDLKEREEMKNALFFILEEAKMAATSDIGQITFEKIKKKLTDSITNENLKESLEIVLPTLENYYKGLIDETDKTRMQNRTMQRLRYGIVAIGMTSPKLQETLQALLMGVEESVKETEEAILVARKNLEKWFDDSMSSLSGWYKRKSQWALFIIGLILAIFLNVDTVNLATRLWREPTLRQALVQNAEKFILEEQNPPDGDESTPPGAIVAKLQLELDSLRIPFGWETESYVLKAQETCQIIPVSKGAVWGLWSKDACKKIINAPKDSTAWLGKIFGFLITGVAAAQGAPFWFDILKKMINVRSSNPNPGEKK